jgi:hypothetical protein
MALRWHCKQQNMLEGFTGEGRSAAPFCHRLVIGTTPMIHLRRHPHQRMARSRRHR